MYYNTEKLIELIMELDTETIDITTRMFAETDHKVTLYDLSDCKARIIKELNDLSPDKLKKFFDYEHSDGSRNYLECLNKNVKAWVLNNLKNYLQITSGAYRSGIEIFLFPKVK